MLFNNIAIVIVSLGVYANGELCVDSSLTIKTDSVNKLSCLELVDKDLLDCLQPDIRSHCKRSCEVSFCCADSKTTFGVVLPGTTRAKYKTCAWKPLQRLECSLVEGLTESCPVMCGTCDPVNELLQIIGDAKDKTVEEINSLQHEVTETKKEQGELLQIIGDAKDKTVEEINSLKDEVTETKNELLQIIGDAKDKTVEEVNSLQHEVAETKKDQGERIDVLETVVGVHVYGDYLYKISEHNLHWADHEAAAVEWGGHLVSIQNAAEDDFVNSLLDGFYHSYRYAHIGAKLNAGGVFEYTDGIDVDYTNWNVGQPDKSGGSQNTVAIDSISNKWFDVPDFRYTWGGVYKKLNPYR